MIVTTGVRGTGGRPHLGIGRAFAGMRVTLYVAGDHVRVVSEQGELLGQCEIDATRGYQPLNKTI